MGFLEPISVLQAFFTGYSFYLFQLPHKGMKEFLHHVCYYRFVNTIIIIILLNYCTVIAHNK